MAAELTALIGMNDHRVLGLTTPNRHQQCVKDLHTIAVFRFALMTPLHVSEFNGSKLSSKLDAIQYAVKRRSEIRLFCATLWQVVGSRSGRFLDFEGGTRAVPPHRKRRMWISSQMILKGLLSTRKHASPTNDS
jgi:hypothetical protein